MFIAVAGVKGPSSPTLKQILVTKPKNGDKAQTITNESMATIIHEMLTTLKSSELYQTSLCLPQQKIQITNIQNTNC
jgi:hypothetical protein